MAAGANLEDGQGQGQLGAENSKRRGKRPDAQASRRWLIGLLWLALAASSLVFVVGRESGLDNLYVHQAQAFLHGSLAIDAQLTDVAVVGGRYYVPFPPFPALVLLPSVALLGAEMTKPSLIALLLTVLNVLSLRRILRQLDLGDDTAFWLCGAFFLGTGYWSALEGSSWVWSFAQVVATTCLLLAIREALGKGRGFLVGLSLGLAFLSRQLAGCAGLLLIAILWQRHASNGRRAQLRNLVGFAVAAAVCGGIYLAFNWARFGNAFDTGYEYIVLEDVLKARVDRFGLFSPAYLPANLFYMFLQGFHLQFRAPDYLAASGMDAFGTSITVASPFIFLAFRARWDKKLLWGAWVSILLPLTASLLYYNNGWRQVNAQRFTLDWMPALILLVALGARQAPARIWKGCIAWAIGLNLLALTVVPLWAVLAQ